MNATARPATTSCLARVAPGLVGFLHFFTLGAALPLLPLYLRGTLGYSWTLSGVILTAIPFSLLISQIFVRSLSRFGIDVRLGLAVSHLMAAGVAMAAAFRGELTADATSDWRYVFGFTILYFSLLAPSVSSIARVGDAATSSGRSVIPRVAIFQLPRNTSREDSVVWRSESDVYATGRSPVNLE